MTTKPSSAPWADEPFHLIPTPSKRLDVCMALDQLHGISTDTLQGSLAHVYCATMMSHAHNTIIRGLNAIIQQAPYVGPEDAKDLLFYVKAWTKMINHHHDVEESFIFPELEAFSGVEGLMDDPKHQHALFHDNLEKLLEYSSSTKPEDYTWEGPGGMKDIIDSFSGPLTDHLYAEIDVLLALGHLDGDKLRQTWDKADTIAKQTGNIAMLVSLEIPHICRSAADGRLLVRHLPLSPRLCR
jgi:hemerythrin HHE cation binding domain-containing protein